MPKQQPRDTKKKKKQKKRNETSNEQVQLNIPLANKLQAKCILSIHKNIDIKSNPLTISFALPPTILNDFEASINFDNVYLYTDLFRPLADNNNAQITKRELEHNFGMGGNECEKIKVVDKKSDTRNTFEFTFSNRPKAPSPSDAVLVVIPIHIKTSLEEKDTFVGLRVIKDSFSRISFENPVSPIDDQYAKEFLTLLDKLSRKRKSPSRSDDNVKRSKTDLSSAPIDPSSIECLYKSRKKSPQSANDIIEKNMGIINQEIADYCKVYNYLQKGLEKCKRSNYEAHKELQDRMLDIIKNVGSRIVVAVFAKPGYGKSHMLNRLISGNHEYPLPSGRSTNGKGLTGTVIDIEYSNEYSLSKQMCTKEEYQLRKSCLPASCTPLPYNPQVYDIITIDDEVQMYSDVFLDDEDEGDCENSFVALCKRAKRKIEEYEMKKDNIDLLSVKRLILRMPSPFLESEMVTLRDMPGYDEKTSFDMYKQYIKESMLDVSLVLGGIENNRYILDDGMVKKLWEYGLYQAGQVVFPDYSVVLNNPLSNEESYHELLNNTSLEKRMTAAFSKQLSIFYNVLIDGVELSENEISNCGDVDFLNKVEFVQNLNDNFSILSFPPDDVTIDIFHKQLSTAIENSRRKLIDCAFSELRNIAIVMLTGPCSKVKESRIPEKQINRLKIISEKIYQKISSSISQISASCPAIDEVELSHVADFIDGLIGYYESFATEPCSSESINEIIQDEYKTYKRMLKKESVLKTWNTSCNTYRQGVQVRIEGFVARVKQFGKTLSSKIKKHCSQTFSDHWNQELAEELIMHLTCSEGSIDNDQVHYIYNEIISYQTQIEFYLKELEVAICDASVGTNKSIKDLISKYKNKYNKEPVTATETPLPKPSRLINQFSIPCEESDDCSDLLRKKVCGNLDSMSNYNEKKIDRYDIDLVVVPPPEDHGENIIHIVLNRECKHLEITHHGSIANRFSEIARLDAPSIKPVFIITRPRGYKWKPNLHKGTNGCTFVIVTESKYLERYKNNVGNDANYIFMSVESNVPLGPGIMRCCVFRVAQYFKLECAHISHDDIKTIYEYSYLKKSYVDRRDPLLRCLGFMEKVLSHELFSIEKRADYIEKLQNIINNKLDGDVLDLVDNLGLYDRKTLSEYSLAEIVMDEVMEKVKSPKERLSFTKTIGDLVSGNSRSVVTHHEHIANIASNPQPLIETLKRMYSYGVGSSIVLMEKIEAIFDMKSHIGRVSLPCYQRLSSLKYRAHDLSNPTHSVSYPRSSLSTYYVPSMEGIYPISYDNFWEEPDNNERKSLLSDIASTKKKDKKMNKKEYKAARRGWAFVDLAEKSQMTLNGVGGFQIIAFTYTPNFSKVSLTNYKPRHSFKVHYDSDQEPPVTIEITDDSSDDNGDDVGDCYENDENVDEEGDDSVKMEDQY